MIKWGFQYHKLFLQVLCLQVRNLIIHEHFFFQAIPNTLSHNRGSKRRYNLSSAISEKKKNFWYREILRQVKKRNDVFTLLWKLRCQ